MSSRRPFIVAIDGPAGAGKSTASRLLAARLGFALVDTGAIYRTVALAATRLGVALDDDAGLQSLLPGVDIRFAPPAAGGAGQRVLLASEDVSAQIRTPSISAGASKVSARPVVRAGLLELQRRLAVAPENRGAVLEGRDEGAARPRYAIAPSSVAAMSVRGRPVREGSPDSRRGARKDT